MWSPDRCLCQCGQQAHSVWVKVTPSRLPEQSLETQRPWGSSSWQEPCFRSPWNSPGMNYVHGQQEMCILRCQVRKIKTKAPRKKSSTIIIAMGCFPLYFSIFSSTKNVLTIFNISWIKCGSEVPETPPSWSSWCWPAALVWKSQFLIPASINREPGHWYKNHE